MLGSDSIPYPIDFKVVRLLNVQFRSASNLLHISQEAEVYNVSSGLWRASGIKWKKKKKKREQIKRAGELLESSSGSKGKIKEERMKE